MSRIVRAGIAGLCTATLLVLSAGPAAEATTRTLPRTSACSTGFVSTAVKLPSPWVQGHVVSVSAPSTTSAYAVVQVGYAPSSSKPGGSLVEHWNGSYWSVVNTGLPVADTLRSVSAPAATDIWVAGQGVVAHFDGVAWSVMTSGLGVENADFRAIRALSPTNVWAAGADSTGAVVVHLVAGAFQNTDAPAGSSGGVYRDLSISGGIVFAMGEGSLNPMTAIAASYASGVWTKLKSDSMSNFRTVAAVSATTAYASGNLSLGGARLRKISSGVWSTISNGQSNSDAVGARSSKFVISAGDGGSSGGPLTRMYDGTSWSTMKTSTDTGWVGITVYNLVAASTLGVVWMGGAHSKVGSQLQTPFAEYYCK